MRPTTVAIIGAPGAGKTTVGQLLANRLGVPHVDVDALIEAEQGKPIGDIFADEGEDHFRHLERSMTLAALAEPGVVSLGGGAVMTPVIREALNDHEVVWLRVSVAESTRRIGLTQVRPLLLGNVRARLIQLLAERTPVYEAVATVSVETDRKTPAQIVDEIIHQLDGVSA